MSDTIDIRKKQLDDGTATIAANKSQIVNSRSDGFVATNFNNYLKDTGNNAAILDPKKRKQLQEQHANDLRLYKENQGLQKGIDQTQAVVKSEQELLGDAQAAGQNVDSLGLDLRLDRIRDDESVNEARGAYAAATDLSLVRDRAVEGLQGAEQSANRQLMARLGQSGVKGGLAGGALTDMASMNLRDRASLERDLSIQNVQANQQRAQFETQLAQFDLGQASAEKSMRNTAIVGLTANSQLQRSGMKQEDIAKKMGNMSGGSSPTVLCTAMFYHGFIDLQSFYCDVEAGRNFLSDRKTRKAFLLYNKTCKPIANYAIKNRWFAQILRPFIVPIAKSFSDNNRLGKILFNILSVPFKLAARFK